MTVPVLVECCDGQFAASLVGQPNVRVVRPTREEALAALAAELQNRVGRGELVMLEVPSEGLLGLAGKYADDPTLGDICTEAYAQRDQEADSSAP